jgi:hypothetical protein
MPARVGRTVLRLTFPQSWAVLAGEPGLGPSPDPDPDWQRVYADTDGAVHVRSAR